MGIVRRAFGLGRWFAILLALMVAGPALAHNDEVQTTWRLLDYLAVDYSGAVSNGKVVSASEYAEMREFSASVHDKLAALPNKPGKAALMSSSDRLRTAIDRKASSQEVANIAHGLAADLLRSYPVAMAPSSVPDIGRGARLYASTCAACHGATGHADSDAARALNPPPIAFADRTRADQRSPFALYQVIGHGIEGTAMASFSSLPAQDRWDLAYYASRFAYPGV